MSPSQGVILIMVGVLILYLVWNPKLALFADTSGKTHAQATAGGNVA